jgi:hypothetical protein
MIKIFVSYVGIIEVIQEHISVIVVEVFGHVYIYLNPLGHTLKGLTSIEYEFDEWIREREYSENVRESLEIVPRCQR